MFTNLRFGYSLRIIVIVLCLEPLTVSAQRVASRRQQSASREQTGTGQEDVDALIAEAQARAGTGGSVRITQKKEKSSMKTVYLDETNGNVPPNELVHENVKVYIESQAEQSEWSTVFGAQTRPVPTVVVPTVQNRWITFNGSSWYMYDFKNLPSDYLDRNQRETFNVSFTTNRPDSLLWFTGNDRESLQLTLRGGVLYLTVIRSGREDQSVRILSDQRLDDNRVHNVTISRFDRRVSVTVDGRNSVDMVKYLNYDVDLIGNDNTVFLGGSRDTSRLTQSQVRDNFRGTIRKAVISGNTFPGDLDLLGFALTKPTPVYVIINGDFDGEVWSSASRATSPTRTSARATPSTTRRPSTRTTTTTTPVIRGETSVTFDSGLSYMGFSSWNPRYNGSIEFSFQTLEPNGLIMVSNQRPGRRDFFALEIVDGTLVALFNFGSERTQRFVLGTGVDDGQPHRVRISRDGRNVLLVLDNEEQRDVIDSEIDDISLDLGSLLFVGGVDNRNNLPWHLVSRQRERFYRGCLWNLRLDDRPEFVELVRGNQRLPPGAQAGCQAPPLGLCGPQYCDHGGICRQRWDGPICDCSRTAFTGIRCERDAPLISFSSGDSFRKLKVPPPRETHTNDITIHFRTSKEDGVLFSTSNSVDDGYIKAYLDRGRVMVDVHIPGSESDVSIPVQCNYFLNDNEWHILYIKRRAGDVEAFVDNCRPVEGFLPNENFTLGIEHISVGRTNMNDPNGAIFYGNLRNLHLDGRRLFDNMLSGELVNPTTTQRSTVRVTMSTPANVVDVDPGSLLPTDPITFPPNYNSYIRVEPDRVRSILDQRVKFMFRTNEPNGLLLHAAVPNSARYVAVELHDGVPRVDYDDGGLQTGQRVVDGPSSLILNDGQWHQLDLLSVANGSNQVIVRVDGVEIARIAASLTSLFEPVYIGGIPEGRMNLAQKATTRRGFVGCVAVLIVNGRRFDLQQIAANSNVLQAGCVLSNPVRHCINNRCQHRGSCVEDFSGYYCDCNMTSWGGPYCHLEAEGFLFGESLGSGISLYSLSPPRDTNIDKISFGLMTHQSNATLMRIDSGIVDFIEFQLINGQIVAHYDMGDSEQWITETRRRVNDGRYHYITFVRNHSDVTFQVDDMPTRRKQHDPAAILFNHQAVIKIGGNLDRDDNIVNQYDGILAGVYVNGIRVIDKHVYEHDVRVKLEGDVSVAEHPFALPIRRFTAKPVPPEEPEPVVPVVPEEKVPPGRADADGEKIVIPPNGGPDVDGAGGGVVSGGGGPVPSGGEREAPLIGVAVVSGTVGGDAGGTRAGAVAGAMLGLLAAASSLIWALYKFKPGLIPLGLGGASGGGNKMVISGPQSVQTPLLVAESSSPANSAPNNAPPGGMVAVTVTRGAPSGTSSNVAEYFSAIASSPANAANSSGAPPVPVDEDTMMNSLDPDLQAANSPANRGRPGRSVGSGGSAQDIYDQPLLASSVGAANAGQGGFGTMHRGIQTDILITDGSASGSASAAIVSGGGGGGGVGGSSSSYMETTTIRNVYSAEHQAGSMGSAAGMGMYSTGMDAGDGLLTSSTFSHDQRSLGVGGMQSNAYLATSPTASEATMFGATAYHMQNVSLSAGGMVAAPNLMTTAEQIRVDCVQLTNNGRFVITGSIYGPPQVWDLKTGELINAMVGEDLSSTDLHLANGDTLLVGQVAEVEQVDSADIAASSRPHHRKLQIWDFDSGRPMEMRKNESCTASCMMSDGERMVLARTERFGSGVTVVIWDVLGNEPIRYLKYDSPSNVADHVSFVGVSRDGRFVVAAYQNSYDGRANFIIFDVSENDFTVPKVLTLAAAVDVTAILDNHEAVTGTLAGELVIWSLKTGKVLRQLVPKSGVSGAAHEREIKALAVSKDVGLLVSGSADSTLKIWNLDDDSLQMTLSGHRDEVWCCAISNDNELVVSGSRDHTIRMWRVSDGTAVTAIDAGVDVFKVLISNNKKTVVALADKFAARKLVMLQVVRSKTKTVTTTSQTNTATMR